MPEPLLLKVVEYTDINHWRWVLDDGRGGFLGDHTVALDPRAPDYPGFLALPGLLRHLAAPDRAEADNRKHLAAFGDWLGVQAFGPLAATIAEHAPVTVRVRVPEAAAELVLRPFEAARINGKPLALAGIALVFEVTDDPPRPVVEPVAGSLRVLGVFSVPPTQHPLNLRAERQVLRRLARRLSGGGRRAAVEVRTLQYGASRRTLQEALEEGAGWDIVHFSGHGTPGEVMLEGPDGRITSTELAELLRPNRARLKLVTVSACDSGAASLAATLRWLDLDPAAVLAAEDDAASPEADPAPVARELTRALDCAVLAMRFPVGDEFAIDWAGQLYEQLFVQRQPLPEAARRALAKAAGPGTTAAALSVATPALFGRRAAGLTLVPPAAPPEGFPVPETGLSHFPAEPERFVGRVAIMTSASAALAEDSGRSGVLFLGMAGAGKTACALELAWHLEPTQRFQAGVWYKAPDRGADITTALRDFAVAMEVQLSGFAMIQVVGHDDVLTAWLPRLRAVLERNALLIVLDNLESLLTDRGEWRDPQWGRVMTALLDHRGLSRTVLTSRVRPQGLPGGVVVEPVHALPLGEALLLMRTLPNLGRLFRGDGAALARRVLRVVQGHPKLIELAEGQAGNPAALGVQVGQAEQAWHDGGSALDAFFAEGRSALADPAFLAALAGWTDTVAATLSPAARTLFHFLCAIEEDDREDGIIGNNWAGLWHRLGHPDPVPPLAETLAPLVAAGLVEPVADGEVVRCHLHPGVADAGRRTAGPAFRTATDHELAAFWAAAYQQGLATETQGGGPLIRRAGLAAASYLMRLERWDAAGELLQTVVIRDRSATTLAAVLPRFRLIVDATAGTESRLGNRGVLARILWYAGQTAEAEAMMREIVTEAATLGRFRSASAATCDLINLLRATGRAETALDLIEALKAYTRQAGLGPWSQLNGESMRLRLLAALGRYPEVLQAVADLRPDMVALPEDSGVKEAIDPWNVREIILDAGCTAALHTGDWQQALDLNAEITTSEMARGASGLERARTRFNDYGPLLGLKRYGEARTVLDDARRVFEQENAVAPLGRALLALADLEHRLGRPAAARGFEEQALRPIYLAGEPRDCANSHFNLASSMLDGAGTPVEALAHRLAAVIIGALTASGDLQQDLAAIGRHLAARGPAAREVVPASFAALCDTVEAIEGVRFRELVERLSAGRFDPDDLLRQVVEHGFTLAAEIPEPA